MEKKINFETYLVISHDKYEIFLLDIKNIKIFYQNEFKVENASEKINLIILNEFLETNIFKIETTISASISVAVAEILILAWVAIHPEYQVLSGWPLLLSIFQGILIGSATGIALGYLLMLTIRHVVTSKPQLVLGAVAFTLIGYVVSFSITPSS